MGFIFSTPSVEVQRIKNHDQNKIDHWRLGKVSIVETLSQKRMAYLHTAPVGVKYQQWLEQKNGAGIDSHPALLFPMELSPEKAEGCCAGQDKVLVVFPYFEYCLALEISQRKHKMAYYREADLWYFIFTMCEAISHFELRLQRVGDIRPFNILANSQGQPALINRYSWPGELTGLGKLAERFDTNPIQPYLSPEEVTSYKHNNFSSTFYSPKMDAFSLGITMLDLIYLEPSTSLYDYETRSFNEQALKEKISGIENRYPAYLRTMVQSLISMQPGARNSAGQVYAILSPFQKDIQNMKPFRPNKGLSQPALKKYQQKYLDSYETKASEKGMDSYRGSYGGLTTLTNI